MAFAEAARGLESIKIVFGGNATSKGLTMRCSAFVEFGIRLAGEKEKGNMAIKLLKKILDASDSFGVWQVPDRFTPFTPFSKEYSYYWRTYWICNIRWRRR